MGLSTHQFSLGEDFGWEQYSQSQHFIAPILFSIPASPSLILILWSCASHWGALTWWFSGFVINVSLQGSSSLSSIAQSLALRMQSFVLRVLAVANEYCTNLHNVETAEGVGFLRPFQQKKQCSVTFKRPQFRKNFDSYSLCDFAQVI